MNTPLEPTDPVEQRRLSNATLAVIGGASLALSLYLGRDFLLKVLMAAFLAVLCLPAKRFLDRRFKRKPHLVAGLLTMGVLVLIIIPVGLLVFLLIDQIVHALDLIRDEFGDNGLVSLLHGKLPYQMAGLVAHVESIIPITKDQIRDQLVGLSKFVAPTVAGILAFSGSTLFSIFVTLMALFFFFLDGDTLVGWIRRILPLEPRYSTELFAEFRSVSYAMVTGSVLTSLVCGIVACLGYWIIGVPSPFVWGTLTGLCQVAPAVGSMLIWIPVAVVLLLMGKVATALLMTGFCVLFLGIGIDNLLRPLIVGRNLALHPLLIFIGILGGITTFGLAGLVVGPMILAFCTATLRIYLRDFVGPPVSPAEESATPAQIFVSRE